jgi:branched-chain amino acid transport system ATP-binding protein
MSGGEQQMLAVARGLMARPRLLLLDEPSLGLAQIITRGLFQQLEDINREESVSMLIVEQNAELALSFAHRGYVLESGSIVLSGTADEVRGNEDMRRAYLGY